MQETTASKAKWYHKPASIVVAVLLVGPLALPLVWISPALKRWQKIVITALLLAISVWLYKESARLYQAIVDQLDQIKAIQG